MLHGMDETVSQFGAAKIGDKVLRINMLEEKFGLLLVATFW
jgi:hypothetical protein